MTIEFNEDFETILVCAVRYSIGRQTYMPRLVIDYITPLLKNLSDKTLDVLLKDIKNAGYYGNKYIDEPVWMNFMNSIENELNKRKQ